jgi:hypothetical protein
MKRREFIQVVGMAAVAAGAVALLPMPRTRVLKNDFFPHGTRFRLFMMHNRLRDDQRVFVWTTAGRYDFTVDNGNHLPAGDWWCLGELRWIVDAKGKYFEHHLVPNFPRIN